jgi:hypothetical protein
MALSFFEPDAEATAGSRTFDISVNGKVVLRASVKEVPVTVTNGRLSIDFQLVKGKAILSAISITQ